MKKIVLVFLLSNFADWEAGYLTTELNSDKESNPYCIKTVGVSGEPVHSIGGLTVVPDYSLESLPDDYEALILIGGTSWRQPVAEQVVPLVKITLQNQKLVAGICDASAFLAKHCFLNNVKHTSNSLKDLKIYAADEYTNAQNYLNEPAVADGNIITANGTAPLEFARLVFTKLQLDSDQAIKMWYDCYKLGAIEAAKIYGLDF